MPPRVHVHAPRFPGLHLERRPFWHRPETHMGRLAGLFLAVVVFLALINPIMMDVNIGYELAGWRQIVVTAYIWLLVGMSVISGLAGINAILRHADRSWVAWLAVMPGLFVLAFLLGSLFPPQI